MIIHDTKDPEEMFGAYHVSDLWCTTGNATLKVPTMALVMGAGHAKRTLETFDKDGKLFLDQKLGKMIDLTCARYHHHGVYKHLKYDSKPYIEHRTGRVRVYQAYGLLISPSWPEAKLGVFQTKDFWANDSTIELVDFSVRCLVSFVERATNRLGRPPRIDMPFPGIGLGNLEPDKVLPLFQNRNVGDLHLWRLKWTPKKQENSLMPVSIL